MPRWWDAYSPNESGVVKSAPSRDGRELFFAVVANEEFRCEAKPVNQLLGMMRGR